MRANGKDAYWFPHDANARTDPKVQALIRDHGSAGYGLFWIIVEMLREQDGYRMMQAQYVWSAIAMQSQCEFEDVQQFISDCITKYQLLDEDEGYIYSPSLNRRMGRADERREKNRKSAETRWECERNANALRTHKKRSANGMRSTLSLTLTEIETIYSLYVSKIRGGAKASALKWIKRRGTEHTAEELTRAVEAYAAEVARKKTGMQYRIQPNNFFGEAERYRDYLNGAPPEEVPTYTVHTDLGEPWEDAR